MYPEVPICLRPPPSAGISPGHQSAGQRERKQCTPRHSLHCSSWGKCHLQSPVCSCNRAEQTLFSDLRGTTLMPGGWVIHSQAALWTPKAAGTDLCTKPNQTDFGYLRRHKLDWNVSHDWGIHEVFLPCGICCSLFELWHWDFNGETTRVFTPFGLLFKLGGRWKLWALCHTV